MENTQVLTKEEHRKAYWYKQDRLSRLIESTYQAIEDTEDTKAKELLRNIWEYLVLADKTLK